MSDATAAPDAESLADEEQGEQDGEAAASGRRRLPGKTLVLFIVLPIVLLLATGGGLYVSGLLDPLLGHDKPVADDLAEAVEERGPSVYYELPDMLVNLNSTGRKTGYLKLSVSLELASEEDQKHIEQALPRVIDNFQVYLRELRVEDLQGSAGLQRLREELLLRVAMAAHPVEVRDVLFREMLIQ